MESFRGRKRIAIENGIEVRIMEEKQQKEKKQSSRVFLDEEAVEGGKSPSMGSQLLMRLFFRQLCFVTVLNLVLVTPFFIGLLVWAERSIHSVAEMIREEGFPTSESIQWMSVSQVQFTYLERAVEGLDLAGKLPSLSFTESGMRNYHKAVYWIEFEHPEQNYVLSIDLTDFEVLIHIMSYVCLFVESCFLLLNLFGNNISVRRTLRPIEDLAETATRLNEQRYFSQQEMDTLAWELEKINGTHLDSRIHLPHTYKELTSIAVAINSMLDRITESYAVQMRFVSDASHELRTPIAVIQGYSAMLDRWGKSDPEILQESIDAIRGEAKSMQQLMEQLLFLARGDHQSQPVNFSCVNVSALSEEVLKEEEMIYPDHEILRGWDADYDVVADPTLLKQLLRILVDNSLKYTPVGGRVWIKLEQKEQQIWVTVQDEGMGIPAKDIPHIFQRFYRTDASRTRETGGTGLGLSIAFWIANQHMAWFDIVSREEIGTRISFPLAIYEEE